MNLTIQGAIALEDWKKIINNITRDVKVKRFNLAGGEPLVASYIQDLINYIHSLGIDCSIITNGSLLTNEFITNNIGKLSMIGISVDGLTKEDNIKIGRSDIFGRTVSNDRLFELSQCIHNAGIKLKINTVANAINYDKDFTQLITVLKPERWKILRMTSFNGINDNNDNLSITNEQFNDFVERHTKLSPVVEDSNDIVHAYIVVNPHGQLIDNSTGSCEMSNSLLTHSFAEEFAKVGIDFDSYMKRYQQVA